MPSKVHDKINQEFVVEGVKKRTYVDEDDKSSQLRAPIEGGVEPKYHGYPRDGSDLKLEVNLPRLPKPTPRQAATVSRSIPTPLPKPEYKSKFLVDWFGDIHSFALGSSSDQQFRVRHAPLPEAGSPWPMPQIYRPTDIVFHLSDDFRMHAIGETCDVLEFNLKRIHDNVFGSEPTREPLERRETKRTGSMYSISHLNVTVLKECDHYPSFEMDESCKYTLNLEVLCCVRMLVFTRE